MLIPVGPGVYRLGPLDASALVVTFIYDGLKRRRSISAEASADGAEKLQGVFGRVTMVYDTSDGMRSRPQQTD
jgi:hypothetical protein